MRDVQMNTHVRATVPGFKAILYSVCACQTADWTELLNKNLAAHITCPHWPVASRDMHTGYKYLIAVKSTIPDINHHTT